MSDEMSLEEVTRRVEEETEALATRLAKLLLFSVSAEFKALSPDMRTLLKSQANYMSLYYKVLEARLELMHEELANARLHD